MQRIHRGCPLTHGAVHAIKRELHPIAHCFLSASCLLILCAFLALAVQAAPALAQDEPAFRYEATLDAGGITLRIDATVTAPSGPVAPLQATLIRGDERFSEALLQSPDTRTAEELPPFPGDPDSVEGASMSSRLYRTAAGELLTFGVDGGFQYLKEPYSSCLSLMGASQKEQTYDGAALHRVPDLPGLSFAQALEKATAYAALLGLETSAPSKVVAMDEETVRSRAALTGVSPDALPETAFYYVELPVRVEGFPAIESGYQFVSTGFLSPGTGIQAYVGKDGVFSFYVWGIFQETRTSGDTRTPLTLQEAVECLRRELSLLISEQPVQIRAIRLQYVVYPVEGFRRTFSLRPAWCFYRGSQLSFCFDAFTGARIQ